MWVAVLVMGVARIAPARDGVTFGASVEVMHDSNPFRLSPKQIEKFETDDRSDEKYFEMESVTDDMVGVSGRIELQTNGIAGNDLRLRFEPAAMLALRNSKRTHVSVEAGAEHDAWKGADLFVEGELTPNRFKKNYLVDAVDANANGISGGEKTYDEGVSTEAGLLAGVRQRITKSLDATIALGGGAESFAAPFENRDRSIVEIRAGLDFEAGQRAHLALDGRGSFVSTASGHEIVVDDRVRIDTPVDRSNREISVTPGVRLEINDRVDLELEYEWLGRTFTTDTPTDPYRGRVDARHTGLVELRARVAKPVRVSAGALFSRQSTDRPNDADLGRDVIDYERTLAWLGVSASF